MDLRTPRLLLRRWRPEDLDPMAAIDGDPQVTEFLGGRRTRAETEASIARYEAHFEQHGFGFWAVELPGEAPLIGFVGLQHVRFEAAFTPAVEIGWRLGRAWWGRGLATEAARRALAHADELGVGPIVSLTVPANVRSRAVMERLGFRHDPTGDFDHPNLPERHPLRRHVLYRRP